MNKSWKFANEKICMKEKILSNIKLLIEKKVLIKIVFVEEKKILLSKKKFLKRKSWKKNIE